MIYFLAVDEGAKFIAVRTYVEKTVMEVVLRYRDLCPTAVLLFSDGTVWDGNHKSYGRTPWRNELAKDKALAKQYEKDRYDELLAHYGLQNVPKTAEEAAREQKEKSKAKESADWNDRGTDDKVLYVGLERMS